MDPYVTRLLEIIASTGRLSDQGPRSGLGQIEYGKYIGLKLALALYLEDLAKADHMAREAFESGGGSEWKWRDVE